MKPEETIAGPPTDAADPAAWVDRYGDYLYRYALSRLRDANAAEEVVQETFLAGVRSANQFAGRGSEQGWLLAILKRKIIDHVRARNRREASSLDEQDPSERLFDANGNWRGDVFAWRPPDEKVRLDELWRIVKDCLGRLPATQADVFTLSVMEEMDSSEICEQLEITPANLWVRMHRARLGLAKCVGARWLQSGEMKTNG